MFRYKDFLQESNEDFNKEIICHSKRSTIFLYQHKSKDIKLIVKSKKNKKRSLLCSYLIGRFILNKIDSINIMHTYDYVKLRNRDILFQEYVEGKTLKKYLQETRMNSKNHQEDYIKFVTLFVAILMDIVTIQSEVYFCHSDLHLDNIIIEKSDIERTHSSYIAFDNKIEIKTCDHHPILIDFEFATAKRKTKTVIQNKNKIIKYGYLGCFLAGSDILRLLFSLKREVCLSFNPYYMKINEFVDSLFSSCFSIRVDDWKILSEHGKNYFNMTVTRYIFTVPELLIHKLYHENTHMFTEHSEGIHDHSQIVEKKVNKFIDLVSNAHFPLLTSNFDVMELFIRKNKVVKHFVKEWEDNKIISSRLQNRSDLFIKGKKILYMIETFTQYISSFPTNPIKKDDSDTLSSIINYYQFQD
jgi:predicted Ser/Thr protein kinase